MRQILFLLVLLIGVVLPFLFITLNSGWARWAPAILFLLGTLIFGGKVLFFPAPDMAVLGEVVYLMLLGTAASGAFIGGLIVHIWKRK